jgi:hypothetical protein
MRNESGEILAEDGTVIAKGKPGKPDVSPEFLELLIHLYTQQLYYKNLSFYDWHVGFVGSHNYYAIPDYDGTPDGDYDNTTKYGWYLHLLSIASCGRTMANVRR